MSESLTRVLAELPSERSDATRAEYTRVTCRNRLARQSRRASARSSPRTRPGMMPIWQPLIVVLGAAYLTQAIVLALRMFSSF